MYIDERGWRLGYKFIDNRLMLRRIFCCSVVVLLFTDTSHILNILEWMSVSFLLMMKMRVEFSHEKGAKRPDEW